MAGLRHLHLVPLPLVAAVGHIRVVGRLQRVGGHLLRVLQGHRHLAFPSIVIIVPRAPVPVFAHMALLPQQPLQQPVLLQLGSSRATEPVHQPVEVPGTDRKASPTLPRVGVLVVGVSPRLLPSNSAPGGPPEPQGEALGAPSARPAGTTASSHRTGPAG